MDVSDRSALTDAAGRVGAGGPLSVLVWAAGQFDWASADAADAMTWDRLIDVNLTAAAYATRLLLPALLGAAPSALIYLGPSSSRQVFGHNAAYVESKHGLAGLAAAVFLHVRDRGVKVSLISPGLVAAGAGLSSPAGRADPDTLLQPDDVAAAVRFVVTFPAGGCPTEITLQPHRTPATSRTSRQEIDSLLLTKLASVEAGETYVGATSAACRACPTGVSGPHLDTCCSVRFGPIWRIDVPLSFPIIFGGRFRSSTARALTPRQRC